MFDLLLLIGFGLILITGIIISTWLNIWLSHYGIWKNTHVISPIITLLVLVLKIVLHWRWVVKTIQSISILPKLVKTTSTTIATPFSPLLQTDSLLVDRRYFLSLMGFLGASTILVVSNIGLSTKEENSELIPKTIESSESLPPYSQPAAQVPQSKPTATLKATNEVSNISTTTENCVIRCDNQCSYPGRCRHYVDNNGNGKCDWGECL